MDDGVPMHVVCTWCNGFALVEELGPYFNFFYMQYKTTRANGGFQM